jgi:hypothetical protein
MKKYSDINVSEMEKSVHQILECQENILELESKSAEIRSALIQALWSEISEVERMLRC